MVGHDTLNVGMHVRLVLGQPISGSDASWETSWSVKPTPSGYVGSIPTRSTIFVWACSAIGARDPRTVEVRVQVPAGPPKINGVWRSLVVLACFGSRRFVGSNPTTPTISRCCFPIMKHVQADQGNQAILDRRPVSAYWKVFRDRVLPRRRASRVLRSRRRPEWHG